MIKNKLSFGEKIALLAGFDGKEDFPEDVDEDTSAKVVDEYESDEDNKIQSGNKRSLLRARNVKLLEELDERYAGSKISRKKLDKASELKSSRATTTPKDKIKSILQVPLAKRSLESIESDKESFEDDDENVEEDGLGSEMDDVDEEDEDDALIDEEDEDEGLSGTEEESISDTDILEQIEESGDEEGLQTLSASDKISDIEKATATQHQLRIWDALLEVRIRMQRMLLEANKLPQVETLQNTVNNLSQEDSKLSSSVEKGRAATRDLLTKLMDLQGIMIAQNPESSKSLTKKRKAPSEIPSDEEITSSEDEETIDNKSDSKDDQEENEALKNGQPKRKKFKIEDFDSIIQKRYDEFIPFRNEMIQKWNEKTQMSFGKYGKKAAPSHEISTLKQIDHILSNKEKLIKRTHVKRSLYNIIGRNDVEDLEASSDHEIFDDDDFYHQLLRELIERKTSNVSDPVQLSRHWLELQKMRSKLKRKVDTKASKGRKIRYDVHTKLVNFMAPEEKCSMSENAVKELMNSLFGKLS